MPVNRANLIYLKICLFSFLCFGIFLLAKGFGWDGDSFVSACQFVKIINPHIFGVWDPGTAPKLMTMAVFGIFYKIFGNFYLLTFLSVLLNSLLVVVVCRWVLESGGNWFITMVGLLANTLWLSMVVICDNTAFCLPFVFFGLYYYFHKNNKIIGSLLILIASLFRQGPEILFLLFIGIELKRNNRDLRFFSFLLFLFSLGIAHVIWGYRLAYLSKLDFMRNVLYDYPDLSYRHSLTAVFLYFKSIIFQFTRPSVIIFFVLSLLGFMKLRKERNDIKFAGLSVFTSYLFPVTIFTYGGFGISPNYHLELPVCYAIFAAFFYKSGFLKNIFAHLRFKILIKVMVIMILLAFILLKGIGQHGKYEANPNGGGSLKWKNLPELRSLVAQRLGLKAAVMEQDLVFFILDLGDKLKKLDVLHSENDLKNIQYNDYDVILLDRKAEACLDQGVYAFFEKTYINGSRVVFIRKTNL